MTANAHQTYASRASRRRQISVESLMARAEVNRTTAIKVMKAMEIEGLGEFVKGVRGHPTRLEMI